MAKHWLPTRPGIVSRTADGAYGEHLRNRTPAHWLPTTRPVPTPAGAQGGMPPSPELRDKTRKPGFAPYEGYEWQWNDTVNQWQQVKIGGATPSTFTNWLSNYPRLPQSTIPTPAVEYPAPGRPPVPGEPGYQNPFAWRRKNSGWW